MLIILNEILLIEIFKLGQRSFIFFNLMYRDPLKVGTI